MSTTSGPLNSRSQSGFGSKSSKDLRSQQTTNVNSQDMFDRVGNQKGTQEDYDWRARLRPKYGGRDLFWRGSLDIESTNENRQGDM